MFRTKDYLWKFRFKPNGTWILLSLFNFNGWTARQGYVCTDMTATCMILRRIYCYGRCYDFDHIFGMCLTKISEMLWELSEMIYEGHQKIISLFRSSLMDGRDAMYDEKRGIWAILPHCVSFIDVTKSHVFRQGRNFEFLRSLYSGIKEFIVFCFALLQHLTDSYSFVMVLLRAVIMIYSY